MNRLLPLSGTLLIGVAAVAATDPAVRSGPPVDLFFSAVTFEVEGEPDAVLVAWRDDQANIHSGLLHLEDGSFSEFPVQPEAYVNNLAAGVAGPPDDRRAFLVWGGSQLGLRLLVYNAAGVLVSPPATVANSVQVVPKKIAGTDSEALIAYAWDDDPYWDPRVLTVDLDGSVLFEDIADDTATPEQTLGVSVAATPDGDHALVYVVSDTRSARIRRYGAGGDPSPVEFFGDAGANYIPHSALFTPAGVDPFLILAVPSYTPQNFADLRFAYTTLESGAVTLGPELSELAPEYDGAATEVAGLAGSPELVLVLWKEVERDPDCICSVPPPIRVEFLAQLLLAGNPPKAVGAPFTVYLWEEGDAIGPPLSEPILAASDRVPGRFTVLFQSDGLLRYKTIGALGPVVASVEGSEAGTVVRWSPVPAALSYNVIRGMLGNITGTGSAIHLGPVDCVEAGSLDTGTDGWEDTAVPDPGEAFFYLVEPVLADGSNGSYGTGSTGKPRVPGPGECS